MKAGVQESTESTHEVERGWESTVRTQRTERGGGNRTFTIRGVKMSVERVKSKKESSRRVQQSQRY